MNDLVNALYLRADDQYHRALRGAFALAFLAGFAHLTIFNRALQYERDYEQSQAVFRELQEAQDLSNALNESLVRICGDL